MEAPYSCVLGMKGSRKYSRSNLLQLCGFFDTRVKPLHTCSHFSRIAARRAIDDAFACGEFTCRARISQPYFCRSMLAERLLAKSNYDCDKEIRTLELLKIRFGENSLLNCEARPCPRAPDTSYRALPCSC